MEKLYYKNQYIKEFEAEIISIKNTDNKYHVALDKTAFFPGGGGQSCDLGEIDGKTVIDVYEEKGIVYHVLSEEIINKRCIKGKIDWNRREDGMHQHFAQHVLSGCFFKLFNANTVSVHLGREISTVDIVGYLNEDQIRKAEKMANDIIRQNILVEFMTPEANELKNLNLRRDLPNTEDEIRVVKIGELDINACCGVHPAKTLELRMIKIRKYEKNKGNTRIEFLAGERAIKDSLSKDKILRDICVYLSSSEEEALNSIKNLKNNIEDLIKEKKKIDEELMQYEIDELLLNSNKHGEIIILKKIYEERDINYVRKLLNKLNDKDNVISLIAVKNHNKVNVLFGASKNIDFVNMGNLLKELIKFINGKGGGNKFLAQGSGDNINVDEFLNHAYNEIKEKLI
ncbi:DHHA1 domain-containing protein [Clostridium sp. CTA-7]